MLNDPQFWVFVAFVIFILLIFKPVKKILISNLDIKINDIKQNIDQAEQIKKEAQQTLSEIKIKQNEVKEIIKKINEDAQEKIKFIEKDSLLKLDTQIKKKKEILDLRIQQMNQNLKNEINQFIIKNVINTTILIFKNKLDESEKQKLINQSIIETKTFL